MNRFPTCASEIKKRFRHKKGIVGAHLAVGSSRALLDNMFYWLQQQHFTTFLVPQLQRHHTPSAPMGQNRFVPFWHCLFKSNLFSSSFEIKINRFIPTPSLHQAEGGEKDQTTFMRKEKSKLRRLTFCVHEQRKGLFRLFDFLFEMIRTFLTTLAADDDDGAYSTRSTNEPRRHVMIQCLQFLIIVVKSASHDDRGMRTAKSFIGLVACVVKQALKP